MLKKLICKQDINNQGPGNNQISGLQEKRNDINRHLKDKDD